MAGPASNRVEAALRTAALRLDRAGRSWALIGGLAVSARAEPRTTRDVDISVLVTDDSDAESLVFEMRNAGYEVAFVLEHEVTGRLATVRLRAPDEPEADLFVDLLFASSGIEPEVVGAAEPIELVPGLTVRVARTGHLIALKVLARDDRHRPQDWDDIRALVLESDEAEIELARAGLALIERRGYHRERKLLDQLDEILRDLREP